MTDAQKIIHENSKLLGIQEPTLEILTPSEFQTSTMIAAASTDGLSVALNGSLSLTHEDKWFALSHELRHCWQIQKGLFSSTDYRHRGTASLAEYNIQPYEVDAHAWAVLVCELYLGLRPTLEHSLPPAVCVAIQNRKTEILAKELSSFNAL